VTVLYFADTRFPIERANGVQTMASCHALALRGHDVTLVVRPDTAPQPRDPFAFYGLTATPHLRIDTIPAVGGARARRVRFLLSAVRRAVAHQGIVYTRDLGLAAFLLQLPRSRRPRVAYESHGIADVVSREMPALLGRAELAPSQAKIARLARRERFVWRRADVYVTITQALAHELRERFGDRDRVFVVPDGAGAPPAAPPLPQAPAAPPAAPTTLTAGYAGHLYPWKGVDTLVRAIALLPFARAVIVGGHPKEADLARVTRLTARLGIAARVELTGLVPPTDVAARLAAASILVLPNSASAISNRYTSPLKLFEYLAMGRPIVASDLPAFREILTDGETALLVPPDDPEALARALARLAADPELAASLAAGARALAPSFTWTARAERLEAALSGVAA
jgi:glycosyltransferase involved in cell wall biosynthesis